MASERVVNGNVVLSASSGTATLNSVPSSKLIADGAGVISGSLSVSVSGAVQGSCIAASGTGSTTAKNTKLKDNGAGLITESDTVNVTVVGSDTAAFGAPCSFSVNVSVSNPGQNKMKTE